MPNTKKEEPTSKKTNAELSFVRDELSKVSVIKKEFTDDQLNFVKGLVNKDLTDAELLLFLAYSNKLQLNPMTGEIVAVVFNGQYGRTVNTIITRNGKRVVATRTGELDSIESHPIYIKKVVEKAPVMKYVDGEMKATEETKEMEMVTRVEAWEGGALWGAEATVVRNGKPFTVTVPLKEYNTGKNVWASKPETMIKKVAESQALSSAFPEILGSVYDEAEADSIKYRPVETVEDDKPATEGQIETLKSMKKEVPEGLTFNEAVSMLGEGGSK